MSDAYVRALPRLATEPVRRIAFAYGPETSPAWVRAILEQAPRHALDVVDTLAAPSSGTEPVPVLLQAAMRLDRWRMQRVDASLPLASSSVASPRLTSQSAAPRDPAELLLVLGAAAPDPSDRDRSPLGWVHATANGRPLGGPADLVAEVARGVPTATIEVWWTREASSPPACVGRSVAMMRSPVARVNDGAFARRVAELLLEGARVVLDGAGAASPKPDDGPDEERPDPLARLAAADRGRASVPLGVADAVRFLSRRVTGALAARARARLWSIGYRRTRDEAPLEAFARLPESELLVPPPGTAWADPFPVRHEGVDLLFFEEQRTMGRAARLVCAELHGDGRLGPIRPILESGGHVSYPNVFSWQGEWFMVPESASRGEVSLYRATEFPYRWEQECNLMTGVSLVDATLLERDDGWLMLATRITADDVALEETVGFWAPTLTGPWRPHADNPLVSDAYRGRPAGRFLEHNGALLRPAQDSSLQYGYGLSLQQVLAFTPSDWREVTLVHRTADWAPRLDGVHTFNRSSTLTCIDVARRVPRWPG